MGTVLLSPISETCHKARDMLKYLHIVYLNI